MFAIDTQLEQFHSTIRDYDVVDELFLQRLIQNVTDYENNLRSINFPAKRLAKQQRGCLAVDASRGNAMTDDLERRSSTGVVVERFCVQRIRWNIVQSTRGRNTSADGRPGFT